MSDLEARFHETWLGMVQPVEGLVVSVPVLVEAQCMQRCSPALQQRLNDFCAPVDGDAQLAIRDLSPLLDELLGLRADLFDVAAQIPDELSLYVPEGKQIIRPTLALRRRSEVAATGDGASTSHVGARYVALLWDVPEGLPLDKPETTTGPWEYPASAKFDRLLRHCRIPIGILTNRTEVRLAYAPHGESSGSITFRVADMATVGGRPILDAFVMLLSDTRFFGVAPERQLPALLADSRKRQANVTNELADQVLEALEILLRGFEAAAERDGRALLDDALARDDEHLYGGLLTVLLRLVFLLYAEDRSLLPVENEHYARYLSALGLFDELRHDRGAFPDTMSRRFGAWGRLLALFRAVFLGVKHGDLEFPARKGDLFDPHRFPFLEGWGPVGSAPITDAKERADVRVPSVDDETVYRALEKLLVLDGQRLSYRALDVEQIGSVYEGLMGYRVERLRAPAVCLRPLRVWMPADQTLEQPAGQRARWLQEAAGLPKAQAERLSAALRDAKTEDDALEALETQSAANTERLPAGRLVLQPGPERRRTSSHYTPRSLTEPIVRRALEPLMEAMGPTPSSERLLDLKICDPAMGSGAFLVETCRLLADAVVAAWAREGQTATAREEQVTLARRLVAQRCLYGVDKNPFAVSLAKLSLWLITLSKDLPFTFLDHALRYGDSMVGVSLEQIASFHWKPSAQLSLHHAEIRHALDEAIALREQILDLAPDPSPAATQQKQRLLDDADYALRRARLIGDLLVGAFFAAENDRARDKERDRRLHLIAAWLHAKTDPPEELLQLQREIRERIQLFHWMLELPEIFWAERPDPYEADRPNHAAWMDAFVGNPPFAGKNAIADFGGPSYLDWLKTIHEGAHGNADFSAHFFRRAATLIGNHGTMGFIATNTIAQGDTRSSGLQTLVNQGLTIYDATRSMPWPGEAAVAVSVVHLAQGAPSRSISSFRLDGTSTAAINSRLRPKPERPDPAPLRANAGLGFVGTYVLGMGFTLTPEERERLVAKDPRNAERIFPYIGGEEVNSSPTQDFHRYVINFGQMSLEEAEQWPDLLAIVREKVKPERDRLKDNADGRRRRQHWWQFGRDTPALAEAICGLSRCLVNSRHSKHLCFAWQPTGRIFAESLNVYALASDTAFAVLQSRPHAIWARLLSSSMRTDLRYSVSDCFETFPFPALTEDSDSLDRAGSQLERARTRVVRDRQWGLTDLYNALTDPECADSDIEELRAQHEQLDRQVIATYGWSDLEVPPYVATASERFEDEVTDRLLALNKERSESERTTSRPGDGSTRRGWKAQPPTPDEQLTLPVLRTSSRKAGHT